MATTAIAGSVVCLVTVASDFAPMSSRSDSQPELISRVVTRHVGHWAFVLGNVYVLHL